MKVFFKLGQHLAKIWTKVKWHFLWPTVYIQVHWRRRKCWWSHHRRQAASA